MCSVLFVEAVYPLYTDSSIRSYEIVMSYTHVNIRLMLEFSVLQNSLCSDGMDGDEHPQSGSQFNVPLCQGRDHLIISLCSYPVVWASGRTMVDHGGQCVNDDHWWSL